MEINKIINRTQEYVINQVESLARTNPFIGLTKPLLTRFINNNIEKVRGPLSLLADKNGNIDIENIIPEMMESVMNTQPFTIHTSVIGDVNIGGGQITLSMPFTDKNIILNKEDLENLKNILIAEK